MVLPGGLSYRLQVNRNLSLGPCWTPQRRENHFNLSVESLKRPDLLALGYWRLASVL